MRCLSYFFLACLLLLLSSSLNATIIHVPADSSTIQGGINGAVDGDTVLVAAGTYTGDGNRDIDFTGKAIVVMSENGPEVTIIDCQHAGRGFYFHSGEDSTSVLQGFTITNGWADDGGGMYIYYSNPTVTSCIFSENSSDDDGGGMAIWASSPTVINCTFIGNYAIDGGGIAITYLGNLAMINSTFTGNWALSQGGGMYIEYSSCQQGIRCCTFSGNSAGSEGGGIMTVQGTARINSCTFIGNSASYGGAIGNTYYTNYWITNCVISENEASISGGGLKNGSWSDLHLSNSTITNNWSPSGGGIYNTGWGYLGITNCILWGDNSGEIFYESGSGEVTYSNVEGGYLGKGNIDADPRFISSHSFDFLLHPYSPCVDTGDPAIRDFIYDWHPRWPDWYPNGSRSDMGAYGGPGNKGWKP